MTNTYTTLTDVKAWLRTDADSASDDPLLQRLIGAASQYIDTYIGRNIMSQTVTETRNGHGGSGMAVRNTPITNVTSLTMDRVAIPNITDQITYGVTWTRNMIYLRGYRFERGVGNITYTYTGGYTFIPADIAQACIELVGFKYKARDRIGVLSHSQDQIVTDNFVHTDVPPEIQMVMNRYRRVTM